VCGLKPNEIWELKLWEYNTYITAKQSQQKDELANAILTGYYTAYYMHGGKKAKNPQELIKEIYRNKPAKQSYADGLRDIERLRELEQRGN